MDSLRPYHPALFLTALYSLAWGPMLLMRGAYWDGWEFYAQFVNKDYAWVYSVFSPPHNEYHYYTFRLLDAFSDPALAGRAIVFFSWLISGLLLLHILRCFLKWDVYTATLCVAYYLIYPVFIVRFEFIHMFYSAVTLFFTLACYIYLDPYPRSRMLIFIREAIALALFFLAFLINSFLFFFFGFLGVHFFLYSHKNPELSLATTGARWLRRFWYLLLYPFVFMGVKMAFFAPYGIYAGYNKLLILDPSLAVLWRHFEGLWEGFYSGFLWPLVTTLQFLERKYFALAFVIAAAAVLFLFRRFPIVRENPEQTGCAANQFPAFVSFHKRHPHASMIIAGLVFLFLGLFPYVAVGKPPHIYGYGFGLRHSLLMPLGSALLMFGLINCVVKERLQIAAHITVISLSIAFLWFNFFLLDMDWYKQQAIIVELPQIIRAVPSPATFVFADDAANYNWLGRPGSRQDYTGYLQLVSGHERYYGVSARDFATNPQSAELAVASTTYVRITSRRSWTEPKVTEWIYLKYIELFFGEKQLQYEASRILQIALTQESVATK